MSSSFDLIVKNGKCFIDGQLKTADIGICDGIIKSISKIEKTSNEKILDANNLVILPGILIAKPILSLSFLGLQASME